MSGEAEAEAVVGDCTFCGNPITGAHATAGEDIVLHEDCVEPWQLSMLPKCFQCGEAIAGEYLQLEDMATEDHELRDLHTECVDAFKEATRPLCKGCGEKILDDEMHANAEGEHFHQACAGVEGEAAAAAEEGEQAVEPAADAEAPVNEEPAAAEAEAKGDEQPAEPTAAEEEEAPMEETAVPSGEGEQEETAPPPETEAKGEEEEPAQEEEEQGEEAQPEPAVAEEEPPAAATTTSEEPPEVSETTTGPGAEEEKGEAVAEAQEEAQPEGEAASPPAVEETQPEPTATAEPEGAEPPKEEEQPPPEPPAAVETESQAQPTGPATPKEEPAAAAAAKEEEEAVKPEKKEQPHRGRVKGPAKTVAAPPAPVPRKSKSQAPKVEEKSKPPASGPKQAAAKAAAGDKKAPAAAPAKKASPRTSTTTGTTSEAPKEDKKEAPSSKPSSQTATPTSKKSPHPPPKKAPSKAPIAAPPPAAAATEEKAEKKEKEEEKEKVEEKKGPVTKNLDEFDEHLTAPGVNTVGGLFSRLDMNASGKLSLAELDKAVVELWPKFNSKPAIMRAYKAADENNTGFVSKKEFELFLHYIVVYHNTWRKFAAVDTSGDRRLSEKEFIDGAVKLGIEGESEASLKQMFDDMDKNDGGMVLFDEFCAVFAKKGTEHLKEKEEPKPKPAPPAPEERKKEIIPPSPPAPQHGGGGPASAHRPAGKKAAPAPAPSGTGSETASAQRKRPPAVIDTPLAAPKHPKGRAAGPPPAATSSSEDKMDLTGTNPLFPKPRKVRLVGDPTVEALEAKVRERKAAERLRQEELHRKAMAAHEDFERRQAELEAERLRRMEEEREVKRLEFEAKHQAAVAAEEARKQRLQGRLKVDMNVISGTKSIAEKFAERAREVAAEEELERLDKLEKRKQQFATGAQYYQALAEHQRKEKERLESGEKKRANRRVVENAGVPIPAEFHTKARKKLLVHDEEDRVKVIHHRQISHEQRAKRLAYAAEVKEKHKPVADTASAFVHEDKRTTPRESRDTKEEGNLAIRKAHRQQAVHKKAPQEEPSPQQAEG